MKLIIGILAMLLPVLSQGQALSVRPLTIGDTMPDITISHIINYTKPSLKLSALRGKLVILDFWATWCGSCLKKIPFMDSVQKKSGGRMQVILISNEGGAGNNEQKIAARISLWQAATNGTFALPVSVAPNTMLLQLFPHTFIPHYVWISPQGRVIAITSYREMSAANIEAVLSGSQAVMPVKNDNIKLHHPN